MAKAENAKQVFDNICSRFLPGKAGAEKAVFAFNLSNTPYWTVIENGTCNAGEGAPPSPADITLIASEADFVALVNGELNAMAGFMQGKFKVQGNMGAALKMVGWFDFS
jgi:putative sterol carrier protein